MKNLLFLSMGMLLLKANVTAQVLPKAWIKSGTWAGSYNMEIKAKEGINESKAIILESVGKDIYGSGAVIQTINARNYLGKRVKLSAFIRTENVKDFACLILSPQNKMDDFWNNSSNNSEDKKTYLQGNHAYKKIDSYLNVSDNAGNLVIGAMIKGEGKIWIDNINIEIIENLPENPQALSKELQNMDFEDSLNIAPNNKIGYRVENNFIVFCFNPTQFEETTDGMTGWRKNLTDENINQVYLAGDFNKWAPKNKEYLMEKKGDVYEFKMPISKFTDKKIHEFKFVINGRKWVEPKTDMVNKTQSGSWMGNNNLMIIL
jgi:hypothetical protein